MFKMSHGLLTRVVFCLISLKNPHILLLDEPTNHLDMTCIDSLAGAINHFPGGLVLVSHDFRLIGQVAKEIWVCDNKSVGPWKVRSAARRRGGAGRGVARRGAARWRAALRCAAVELERALRRVRAHEVAGGELDLRHGGIRPVVPLSCA